MDTTCAVCGRERGVTGGCGWGSGSWADLSECYRLGYERERTRAQKAEEEVGALREAAQAFLAVTLSGDEARLLMIGTNAAPMARTSSGLGKSLHARCDRIATTGEALRAALSPKGGG